MKILAVVPARAGSKEIPDKNKTYLASGLTITQQAIRLGLEHAHACVISSDDYSYATDIGDAMFHHRPAKLATDDASATDTMIDAWAWVERESGEHYEVGLYLEPTSPLRTTEDIEACLMKVINDHYPAALTVSLTPPHGLPDRQLTVLNGEIGGYTEKSLYNHPRQSLQQTYHRNGLCYCITKHHLFSKQGFCKGAGAVITQRPVVNIDTREDLKRLYELEQETPIR